MVSVWLKKRIRSPATLFVLLCIVFYCAETTTAFTVVPSTNIKQAGLSELSDHYHRCTNTAFRMAGLDGEPPKALEEVDVNQVDLTPPKPAVNKKSVDWTVVLFALYPVWVLCDTIFHITSDKPYIQQLGDSIRSVL